MRQVVDIFTHVRQVNVMGVDVLATQGASASTTIILSTSKSSYDAMQLNVKHMFTHLNIF